MADTKSKAGTAMPRVSLLDRPSPLSWPRTELHTLRSRLGREYRIFLAYPAEPAPPGGYGAIYLLDANAAFGTMVEAVRLQSRRAATTGVAPSVVIGIGYPTDEPLDVRRRTYDFTPPGEAADKDAFMPTGGADEFLDFIVDELMPDIEQRFATDPAHRCVFGHSFGGLFVLHALFARPGAFSHHAAASPSIWWGDEVILREESRYRALAVGCSGNLLVTVGALEQPAGEDSAFRDIRSKRMVDNARQMTARLAEIESPTLRVSFVAFADEGHASVLPAAISRALRFFGDKAARA